MNPPHAHFLCTLLNCFMLFQCLFFQAHSLPFNPRMNIITKFTKGIRQSNAMYVLFPSPHIQFRKKAPQFQLFTMSVVMVDSLLRKALPVDCRSFSSGLPGTVSKDGGGGGINKSDSPGHICFGAKE